MIIDRTAWLEGMLVRPQHFQQQEAFWHCVHNSTLNMLQPHFWGIDKLELDLSALKYNKFLIKNCRGIFPDGTWFHYQQSHINQLSLNLLNENQARTIYLTVTDQDYSQYSETKPTQLAPRYLIKDIQVRDKFSNQHETQEIQVAELNLRLCTDADAAAYSTRLPIAKIKYTDDENGIVLDEEYFPPALNVFATDNFVQFVDAIAGFTERKRRELLTTLNHPNEQQLMQLSTTDGLLLLQIINRYAAILRHQQSQRRLHPQAFYQLLLSYNAELATYTTTGRSINHFASYQHEELSNSFNQLRQQLQAMLQTRISQQAIQIPLSEQLNGMHKGLLNEHDLNGQARIILLVKTNNNPQQMLEELSQHIKISAGSQIDHIIHLQLPGLKLKPLTIAPAVIPYDQRACYFELSTADEYWEKISIEKELCIYITKDYSDISLQLWLLPGWKNSGKN